MDHTKETALRCLRAARAQLIYQAPFLTQALYAMPFVAMKENVPLQTDGRSVYYCADRVCRDVQASRQSLVCQLFHVVAHCLLGHLSQCRNAADRESADYLADLCVHRLMRQMGIYHHRTDHYERAESYYPLSTELRQFQKLSKAERKRHLDSSFIVYHDDHDRWYMSEEDHIPLSTRLFDKNHDWRQMAEQLRTMSGDSKRDDFCAAIDSEMTMGEMSAISYRELLETYLGRPQEQLYADPDSLDARWYYTGLQLYGDIPILEPLEESERPKEGDTVIAVDTSGSCRGKTCRRFLKETAALLRDLNGGKVLLLQCDNKIRQELLIEDSATMAQAVHDFRPKGFGGTDFCPVFERVAQRRQDGTLGKVRCLIYLSDGWGEFPAGPPDYPVLFLLPEGDRDVYRHIPDWVRKVILHTDSFTVEE